MKVEKKNSEKLGQNYKASTRLQVSLLFIMFIFLAWILYKPIITFNTVDTYPTITPLTPQSIIQFGGSPSFVTIGMYIRDLPEFDIVKGVFTTDITLWFKFDPRLVSLEQISKFSFDRAKIIYKSKPSTRIEQDKLIARYDMRLQFTSELNYKHFPLDDHRVSLILTHYFLTPSDIIFESSRSNLIISSEIDIPGWLIIDKSIKTGFIAYKLDPHDLQSNIYYPRAVFSFDFARTGVRHIVSIILPIILIFFISLFTLAFNPFGPNAGNIMSISAAAITAAIAHSFIIERMSPNTGYFMITDYIFLLILTNCCIVFAINLLGTKIIWFYKNIIVIILNVIVAAAFIWLIWPLL